MITIFCSVKLAKLMGADTRHPSLSMNAWNGHLFTLERRKCIVFVHKETLYSFVLFNVLKKELTNFKKVFTDNLLLQLRYDRLLDSTVEKCILKELENMELSTTDGDKSTIGYINDCIARLTFIVDGQSPTIERTKHYVHNYYNENFLMNKTHNKTTPKNNMEEYLDNLKKST